MLGAGCISQDMDCWWANEKDYEIKDQLVKLAQLVVRSGQGDDDVKSMAMMMTFLVSDGPICGANRAVAQPERTMVRSQIFVQHISRFRRKFSDLICSYFFLILTDRK